MREFRINPRLVEGILEYQRQLEFNDERGTARTINWMLEKYMQGMWKETILSIKEAAKWLNVSPHTVQWHIKQGNITAIKGVLKSGGGQYGYGIPLVLLDSFKTRRQRKARNGMSEEAWDKYLIKEAAEAQIRINTRLRMQALQKEAEEKLNPLEQWEKQGVDYDGELGMTKGREPKALPPEE